jgi:hypothetical protein
MKLTYPINLKSIKEIQQNILDHFPWENIDQLSLFYLPDNVKLFLSIKELKTVLNDLGFLPYIRSFAFNVAKPNDVKSIHVDTGPSSYSFNLPLFNCDNTYTIFYQSSKDPILKEYSEMNQIITYRYYDPSFCKEIHRIEMNDPYIINIYTPHNIINPNNSYRITFLIRFIKEFDQYWESKQ